MRDSAGEQPGPRAIDLNADLGEGFGVWRLGDDDALLGIVTSANVACGFHAGDPSTMRRVCARGRRGRASPSARRSPTATWPGFGRRFIDVDPGELADDVLYQLAALDGIARAAGTRVSYVKPHGALYNAAVDHEAQARAVVDAVAAYDGGLPVLGAARLGAAAGGGGGRAAHGARGLRRPRLHRRPARSCRAGSPARCVHDPAAVAERAVRMAVDGEVVAVDGTRRAARVDSVCVHGDTPGAVELARAVRTALEAAGRSGWRRSRAEGVSRPPCPAVQLRCGSAPESRSSATSSTVSTRP